MAANPQPGTHRPRADVRLLLHVRGARRMNPRTPSCFARATMAERPFPQLCRRTRPPPTAPAAKNRACGPLPRGGGSICSAVGSKTATLAASASSACPKPSNRFVKRSVESKPALQTTADNWLIIHTTSFPVPG
jgi:hypothetical protein